MQFEALDQAVHKVSVSLEVSVEGFFVARQLSNEGHKRRKEILNDLPFGDDGTRGALCGIKALLKDVEHQFLQSELKHKK